MGEYDIWLSLVAGAACANGQRIVSCGVSPQWLYDHREKLSKYNIFTARQIKKALETDIKRVEEIYRTHCRLGIKSVNYADADYPQRFKGIDRAPPVIYYKGDISLLSAPHTVSVVGSRRFSAEGEMACRDIVGRISPYAVIVSGLARGVDTTAHRTCVENGGKTVAVLGVSLDKYYPKTNKNFQQMLEKEHLVISEYVCGRRYYSADFVHRNRLIAAAGDRLCVIQAQEHSGSLTTAERALEYSKDVFAVPGSIYSPYYRGSNRLLARGKATALTGGRGLLEYMGISRQEPVKESEPELSRTEKQVLDTLDGAMLAAQIIRQSGLSAGRVKAALTGLELAGLVYKGADGRYVKRR